MSHNVYYVKLYLRLSKFIEKELIRQKFYHLHLGVFPAVHIALFQLKNQRGFVAGKVRILLCQVEAYTRQDASLNPYLEDHVLIIANRAHLTQRFGLHKKDRFRVAFAAGFHQLHGLEKIVVEQMFSLQLIIYQHLHLLRPWFGHLLLYAYMEESGKAFQLVQMNGKPGCHGMAAKLLKCLLTLRQSFMQINLGHRTAGTFENLPLTAHMVICEKDHRPVELLSHARG